MTAERKTVVICRYCSKPIVAELHGGPWRVVGGAPDEHDQHYVHPLHYSCAELVHLQLRGDGAARSGAS